MMALSSQAQNSLFIPHALFAAILLLGASLIGFRQWNSAAAGLYMPPGAAHTHQHVQFAGFASTVHLQDPVPLQGITRQSHRPSERRPTAARHAGLRTVPIPAADAEPSCGSRCLRTRAAVSCAAALAVAVLFVWRRLWRRASDAGAVCPLLAATLAASDVGLDPRPSHGSGSPDWACCATSPDTPDEVIMAPLEECPLQIGSGTWEAFAAASAGVWEGHSVSFDPVAGTPTPWVSWAPDAPAPAVTPDRAGQRTVTSSDSGAHGLIHRTARLLGGGHWDPETDRRMLAGSGEDKTIWADGSYSAGPRVLRSASLAAETCLRLPGAGRPRRVRVRTAFVCEASGPGLVPKLVRCEVIIEERVRPQPDGSARPLGTAEPWPVEPWTASEALGAEQLEAALAALDAAQAEGTAWGLGRGINELNEPRLVLIPPAPEAGPGTGACEDRAMRLPAGLWVRYGGRGGGLFLEAGVVAGGSATRAVREYDGGGRLLAIRLQTA